MSDMKRYLPGSNQDSNQHGNQYSNQYSNQGNIMDQNSDQSSKTNKRSETRRKLVEADDRAREAERDTIFGRVEKATGENDGTGLQMVKKHRAAVALLLALLMTISLAVPSSSEAISNNSRFSMIGTNVHQSAQKPTGDSKDNDRDAAARFLMGTTLLTQGLLSGNTSWSTAMLSDTGFLQRMLEILNLLITDGVIEPEPDLSDSSEDDRDPHTPSRDSEDEPDHVPEDEEPEDPENPDEDENLDDPGETDGPEEPEGSVDPVDPDPGIPDPVDPDPVDPDPGEPGQEPAPIFHTLTLHIDGQGTVTNNVYMEITGGSKEVASGTEVTFLAVPGEGYDFLYWRFTDEPDNALSSNQAYSIEGMTESVSITAHFKAQPEKFTVTLRSSEGGSATFNPAHSSGEFEAGDSVTMVATPDDLYEFSHWSPTHDSEIILSNDVEYGIENIQKNMDVTAHFRIPVIEKFVVTITSSEGGSAGLHADHSSSEFEEGEPVTVVAEPDDHFVFSHWSLAGDSDNELNTNKLYSFDMPENDVDLTAHFALIHKFEGGNGTEDEPYEIKTATQLAELLGNKPMLPEVYAAFSMETDLMQAHYKLVDDIDLSTHTPDDSWGPIGGSGASPASDEVFYGSFDGNGKTIKKLTINQPDESYQAMFHTIGSGAVVKNLTLLDPTITAKSHAAALAVNNHGIIERVEVKSTEVPASPLNNHIGNGAAPVVVVGEKAIDNYTYGAGMVVSNGSEGIIFQSGVEASICIAGESSRGYVGLVIAENRGIISQSYAIGTIDRPLSETLENLIINQGGLLGINRNVSDGDNPLIINSYAIANLHGGSKTGRGGLVGVQNSSLNPDGSVAIQYVYAASKPRNQEEKAIGGILGGDFSRTLLRAYYDKSLIEKLNNNFGTAEAHENMKKEETFEEWNFSTIWKIDSSTNPINNGYPYLRWQTETK